MRFPGASLFKRFREETEVSEDTISDYGVKVVTDKRFNTRLEWAETRVMAIRRGYYVTEEDESNNKVTLSVPEQLDMLDELLRVGCIPFLRAGDKNRFMSVMVSWEKLLAKWEGYRNMLEEFRENTYLLELLVKNSNKIIHQTPDERAKWLDENLKEISKLKRRDFGKWRVDQLIDNFGRQEIIPWGLMIYDASFQHLDVSPQSVAVIQGYGVPVEPADFGHPSRMKLGGKGGNQQQ